MSSVRQLQTGNQYRLPPPGLGLPPTCAQTMEEWKHTLCQLATSGAFDSARKQGGNKKVYMIVCMHMRIHTHEYI